MKVLTAVTDLARLNALWPWVERGLYVVKKRSRARWLPADVYGEIKAGSAVLFTCGQDEGFLVAKSMMDYDGPCLFVWAIWGPLKHIEQEIYADLDQVAANMKAKRIQMRSPRKGWGQRGYFREHEIVYEREV